MNRRSALFSGLAAGVAAAIGVAAKEQSRVGEPKADPEARLRAVEDELTSVKGRVDQLLKDLELVADHRKVLDSWDNWSTTEAPIDDYLSNHTHGPWPPPAITVHSHSFYQQTLTDEEIRSLVVERMRPLLRGI